MITVRSIAPDELAWFGTLAGLADADVEDQIRSLWNEGTGRPEWTLVAEAGGRPVGRLALFAEPLGCEIEEPECHLAGPWLDWHDPAHADAGTALLDAAAQIARPMAPTIVERRLNPEIHTDIDAWRGVLASNGFSLFQEKEGFVWTDAGGPTGMPDRLRFRSIGDVGRDRFADAMGHAIAGTLDRNDRYYLARCGPDGWGRQMVEFCEPGDEDSWLLAFEPDGTLAGYVAVGGFEAGVATISHVAVVPARRGRGYIDDLLAAANAAARRRGDRSMLSDVDTLNAPMRAAMERAGHMRGIRPWHVWAYRRVVGP